MEPRTRHGVDHGAVEPVHAVAEARGHGVHVPQGRAHVRGHADAVPGVTGGAQGPESLPQELELHVGVPFIAAAGEDHRLARPDGYLFPAAPRHEPVDRAVAISDQPDGGALEQHRDAAFLDVPRQQLPEVAAGGGGLALDPEPGSHPVRPGLLRRGGAGGIDGIARGRGPDRVDDHLASEGAEPRFVVMALSHQRLDHLRAGGAAAQEGDVLHRPFPRAEGAHRTGGEPGVAAARSRLLHDQDLGAAVGGGDGRDCAGAAVAHHGHVGLPRRR